MFTWSPNRKIFYLIHLQSIVENIKAVDTLHGCCADGVPILGPSGLILREDLQADSDIKSMLIAPESACTYNLKLARGVLDDPLSKAPGQTPLTAWIGIGIG